MIPHGARFAFVAGYHEKQCPCGGTWTIHCRNKHCRWVVCTSEKHLAVLDYKNGRLWCVVQPEAA